MTARERRKKREKRDKAYQAAVERENALLIGLFSDTYDAPVSYPRSVPPRGHAACPDHLCLGSIEKAKSEKPSYKHIPYVFAMVFFLVLCVWNAVMVVISNPQEMPFRIGVIHLTVVAISLVAGLGVLLSGRWSSKS